MSASRPALDHTVEIETPELVLVSYTIAGIGSRAYAALIDYCICFVALVFLFVVTLAIANGGAFAIGRSGSYAFALLIFAQFVVLWGYYVLWEALADGQTPGKKRLGLRVVRDGGHSITFGASAVRNLVRILDMQPGFTFAVGLTSVALSRTGKRLGDMAAGTLVVREALVARPVAIAADAPPDDAPPPQSALTDEELAVLARFVERRGDLPPERRDALASQLEARLAHALQDVQGNSALARLVRLHAQEQDARRRGAAARGATGARRERHAIVATRSPRWAEFSARLARAQRTGLTSMREEEVREFVAEYRDVASDLARLRTATGGGTSEELFYLGRLVSSAHNLLYRRRALPLETIARTLFVDAPREVRRSWRPILLAALLLFLPGAISYLSVVRHPEVAPIFIPPAMLDRAEDGVRRAREGEGYISDPQLFRPVMASRIIANNVQVSFAAFAMGMTAGIGTILVLVLNGVSLGGVLGLYASKGILALIVAFVAPHGVLELTAICIAGGAGLLLGGALVVPGDRTRRRALVENGRRAIQLIAAAALLLLVAGVLEGFVSPIEWWPLAWKLSVSALTAIALYVYLRAGTTRPEAVPAAEPAAPVDLLALAQERQTAPRALSSR